MILTGYFPSSLVEKKTHFTNIELTMKTTSMIWSILKNSAPIFLNRATLKTYVSEKKTTIFALKVS